MLKCHLSRVSLDEFTTKKRKEIYKMVEQLQLDFTGKRPAARSHFRITTLTTTWDTYRKLKDIDIGVPISVEFVNDIVSSCRGSGNSEDHHTVRRCELLSRQFKGGFRHLKVRAKQGVDLECTMLDKPIGNSDACSCYIRVCKPISKKEAK